MSRKVIITVAPTGGVARKEHNPHLPTQPDEIAKTVINCTKLGASVVAIHARLPDHSATCDAAVYEKINRLIREGGSDIILNNSTGGGSDGDMGFVRPDGIKEIIFSQRLRGCDAPSAEMATFDGFTTIAYYGGEEAIVLTTPTQCETLAKRMKEKNIKPEWEVFTPGHIIDALRLIEKGYDKPPYYFNMVLGGDRNFQGTMPYSTDILSSMAKMLPEGTVWLASALGPAQLPCSVQSLLLGGNARIGLEDNLYYKRGELASNEQLTERLVRIIHELGMEVATPAEARDMIGLPQLKK